jgi:ribulose-phosphate 3-epimerase
MPSIKIAPSILSADFGDIKNQIAHAEQAGADWLHLDIMDGHFVPNITFGPPVVKSLRKLTRLPFDTHLMIENADSYIDAFHAAGANTITVHYEACRHLHRTVTHIKSLGMTAGVCLNPASPVSLLHEILPHIDLVLIMSVNPGFGGQQFIPTSLQKIRETAAMISELQREILLEVDGGVDDSTVEHVVKAGANVLVAGQYIFGSGEVNRSIQTLRQKATAAME